VAGDCRSVNNPPQFLRKLKTALSGSFQNLLHRNDSSSQANNKDKIVVDQKLTEHDELEIVPRNKNELFEVGPEMEVGALGEIAQEPTLTYPSRRGNGRWKFDGMTRRLSSFFGSSSNASSRAESSEVEENVLVEEPAACKVHEKESGGVLDQARYWIEKRKHLNGENRRLSDDCSRHIDPDVSTL